MHAFFDAMQYYPESVVMIDDKRKHLESVREAINRYKGNFLGLRYGYLDEKSAKIDMDKAEEQMKEIMHQFPDKIQLSIKGMFKKSKESHSIEEIKKTLTP